MQMPPLECNAAKDRDTKVCSARRVRKSSKRLKIVERLQHRRACGFCLCLLLGYCTWYYGVFFTILCEHNIAFLSSVPFTFIVFLILKQVVSCWKESITTRVLLLADGFKYAFSAGKMWNVCGMCVTVGRSSQHM